MIVTRASLLKAPNKNAGRKESQFFNINHLFNTGNNNTLVCNQINNFLQYLCHKWRVKAKIFDYPMFCSSFLWSHSMLYISTSAAFAGALRWKRPLSKAFLVHQALVIAIKH